MKPFVVSPNAADDLNNIWLYLATEASEEVADRTLVKLAESFAELGGWPTHKIILGAPFMRGPIAHGWEFAQRTALACSSLFVIPAAGAPGELPRWGR